MSSIGKHGVTTSTPGNILLGAGTIHKGIKFEGGTLVPGTIIGATSGGNKLTIKGEFKDLDIDGMLVKVKGSTVKVGGTATLEANFAEVSKEILKAASLFAEDTSNAPSGYGLLVDKASIAEGDYIENFGFVGTTADGSKQIIVIFENALCTSGLELEGKNKDQAVIKVTMEAYASNSGDLDTLPVKIYYPAT